MSVKLELSRPVDVPLLRGGTRKVALDASTAECAALVVRYAVPAVHSVAGELQFAADPGGLIKVSGTFDASLDLICAVTGEVFTLRLQGEIERFFSANASQDMAAIEFDELDIEPFDGKMLDAGEIVAEELALAIPAFPRSDQADSFLEHYAPADRTERKNPFAVLGGMRDDGSAPNGKSH